MNNDTFQPIEDLLVEAKNRARMVFDGYPVGHAGHQYAYFLCSDISKALAYLRALDAMNV